MQTKTVGVVIPIYNVEKYLRECLDSVINQTYKNLQVILVNDGSTDENSLNIAKEYTLKDKRFILFDKENGGQSTARNVGIEFFSKEYHFKNITQELQENSLVEFKLNNEDNPYNIYKMYKSSNFFKNKDELLNFKAPDIDYIIFLDSDDYWELNCIEECVPRMDGVEVLWFNYKILCDKIKKKHISQMTYFDYKNEVVVTSQEWLKRAKERRLYYFWFAWQGMINFTFLKCIKLKFINEIFAEDCHFGVLLFIQAKNIYIYPNQIYIYRLRELSSMNFTKKKWIIHSNSYLKKIDVFRNSDTARFYYETISWIKIALEFIQFIKNDHVLNYGIKEQFLPVICNRALTLQNFKEDPLCLKIYIKDLELYIQNQPLGAISRVKEYLSYKIKKAIFEFRGIKILLLPFIIIKIILKHQKEVKNYKKNIDKNLLYKRPPLEFYKDYQDAIKLNLSKFKIKA